MTTENWINVAMIIAVIMTAAATLVGPVLAVYVQVRMSQPKPMPDVNAPPPKQPSRFQRVLESRWTPLVAFIVELVGWVVLIWIFIRLPLTKLTIALFVYAAVTLGAHFASIIAYRLLTTVYAFEASCFSDSNLAWASIDNGPSHPAKRRDCGTIKGTAR